MTVVSALCTAMAGSGITQTPMNTQPGAGETIGAGTVSAGTPAPDTIPPKSLAEILSDEATDAYKALKFMQYDGELESVLYPKVLETYRKVMAAFDAADTDELLRKGKNILIDINPMLLQGAVYASNRGDAAALSEYATAYIDTQLMPEMADAGFQRDPNVFPTLVYNAAFGASKAQDAERAKKYLELYLETGDTRMRENVTVYLGQTCLQTGEPSRAIEALEQGSREFPANPRIVTLALQCCLDAGCPDRMQPLLDKALILTPDDESLLNIQANLYESNQDFKQALDIYQKIAENHPNSLENTRRIATCTYNLGAYYYNNSIMEADEKAAKRARRQSKAYFDSAAITLEQILATTPTDAKFQRALTQVYAALGDKERFDAANVRLQALGQQPVSFNAMPSMIGNGLKKVGGSDEIKIPSYDEFARSYIEQRLADWAKRGEFEKMDDYKNRLAGGESADTYRSLNAAAEKEYIDKYGRRLILDDLRLHDYDVDNETFRIDTPYGPTVVKVPLKGKEAEAFKAGWDAAQIRAPRFIVRDNKVAIASVTYVVGGRRYTFDADDAATYTVPNVYVDVNGILAAAMASDGNPATAARPSGSNVAGIWKDSDVDIDIPVTGKKNPNAFALVIANENYDKASEVFGALHDGASMREYCVRTLGIPEQNVIMANNATGNQTRDALATLGRRVKGATGPAEVIFYYAGHGLPDDATKEAYMMPVDANPLTISTLIPMKEIYASLGDMDAAMVSVFLDACFSGMSRDNTSINEARSVAIKAKEVRPQGNMFVLSAASSQETALPYKAKHHGLFTYFLLKKLQESKGNATLRQISDYVIENVRSVSNSVNQKEQNPTMNVSGTVGAMLEKKKLKP